MNIVFPFFTTPMLNSTMTPPSMYLFPVDTIPHHVSIYYHLALVVPYISPFSVSHYPIPSRIKASFSDINSVPNNKILDWSQLKAFA